MWISEKIFGKKEKIGLGYILSQWPGKERFGVYRYLPIFFLSGAFIEYAMIHWKPNGINFYETYKTNYAYKQALKRIQHLKEIEKLLE